MKKERKKGWKWSKESRKRLSESMKKVVRKKTPNLCIDCGKELSGRRKNSRCRKCYIKYNRGENHPSWKDGGITKGICDWCGKEVTQRTGDYKSYNHHFCNKKCEGKWRSVHRRGKDCQNWKGGFKNFTQQLRSIPEYNIWRQKIINKDNNSCRNCGVEENLEAHHIVEFSTLIKDYNITAIEQAVATVELWDINNGMTLCVHCHAEEHPDYRKLILKRVS